jgi:hypothetical protein
VIAGGGAENLQTGNAHNDLLIGGEGEDYIFGDAEQTPARKLLGREEWIERKVKTRRICGN